MPRGDGTGPQGNGPMTGRCLGGCTGCQPGSATKRAGLSRNIGPRRFYNRNNIQQPQEVEQEQVEQQPQRLGLGRRLMRRIRRGFRGGQNK